MRIPLKLNKSNEPVRASDQALSFKLAPEPPPLKEVPIAKVTPSGNCVGFKGVLSLVAIDAQEQEHRFELKYNTFEELESTAQWEASLIPNVTVVQPVPLLFDNASVFETNYFITATIQNTFCNPLLTAIEFEALDFICPPNRAASLVREMLPPEPLFYKTFTINPQLQITLFKIIEYPVGTYVGNLQYKFELFDGVRSASRTLNIELTVLSGNY